MIGLRKTKEICKIVLISIKERGQKHNIAGYKLLYQGNLLKGIDKKTGEESA